MRFLYSSSTSILAIAFISITFHALAQAQPIAKGFQEILQESGVQVYQKDYPGRQPDYVTVVNLEKGTIRNLTGSVTGATTGKVKKKLLGEFWQDAVNKNTSMRKAKVVVNGAFFSTNDDPTGIAFGLKIGGNTISYGYGIGKEYIGQVRIFSFNSQQASANIETYDKRIFDGLTKDVVGGLDVTANKYAEKNLPRTFVGVRDRDGNGTKETVILYSSSYARQIDADNILTGFGASATVMLDGGGSTGLIVDGKPLILTKRKLPHAIAVFAGK
ncbi:MAG: phosphodiester glycosidase family protein [Heteroscytonema crispum UTEX LB 1556]